MVDIENFLRSSRRAYDLIALFPTDPGQAVDPRALDRRRRNEFGRRRYRPPNLLMPALNMQGVVARVGDQLETLGKMWGAAFGNLAVICCIAVTTGALETPAWTASWTICSSLCLFFVLVFSLSCFLRSCLLRRPYSAACCADAVTGSLATRPASSASSCSVRSVNGGRTGPESRPITFMPALMIETA